MGLRTGYTTCPGLLLGLLGPLELQIVLLLLLDCTENNESAGEWTIDPGG